MNDCIIAPPHPCLVAEKTRVNDEKLRSTKFLQNQRAPKLKTLPRADWGLMIDNCYDKTTPSLIEELLQ